MISEKGLKIEQASEAEERGHNTEVRFTFVRHSQKSSGQVFNEAATKLSTSNLSEGGKQRAAAYGGENFSNREVNRAYATNSPRTRETLSAAFQAAGIDPKILEKSETTQAFFSLPTSSGSEEFNKKYEAIMSPERQEYITAHFLGRKFDELTPDEQETVAEYAEEPAIEWYLSFGEKRPDKDTPSPREQAASVAFKINRLINLSDYMPAGKAEDLVSSGHKTSTEAFLKYVIERGADDKKIVGFDRLDEIGGSLKILDSWDLQVRNDDKGEKHISFVLRREDGRTQEYGLSISTINELAKEYIKSNNLTSKKIDEPGETNSL